jgi:hypothetical protein
MTTLTAEQIARRNVAGLRTPAHLVPPTSRTTGSGTYTCAQMILKVREFVGRKLTTTSGLDVDAVILDALNEAQRKIVKRCPDLSELQVKDTSLTARTNDYSYDLSRFDPAIQFIQDVWILNGTSSIHVEYKEQSAFDIRYPVPSANAAGTPRHWTRRGDTIEFNCPLAAAYDGLLIRVDHTAKPTPFALASSTSYSDIRDCEDGLMMFAWSKLLRIIARDKPMLAQEKLVQFNEWLDEFEDQHDMENEELDNE